MTTFWSYNSGEEYKVPLCFEFWRLSRISEVSGEIDRRAGQNLRLINLICFIGGANCNNIINIISLDAESNRFELVIRILSPFLLSLQPQRQHCYLFQKKKLENESLSPVTSDLPHSLDQLSLRVSGSETFNRTQHNTMSVNGQLE